MSKWKAVGVVAEGQPIEIGNLNPWSHSWTLLKEPPIELPHPTYPNQHHKMAIYQIESAGRKIMFAAGELSANVWGFYVPA